jgi:hypothetical protein
MAETIEKSLLDLDFASLTRRTFTPSPAVWEDQVLYFLLLDRFSDGNEQGGYRVHRLIVVDEQHRPIETVSCLDVLAALARCRTDGAGS